MRHDRHRAAVRVADLQGRFQGVEVFRVEDRRQGRPVDRPVLLHGLGRDVGRVGDLLDANDAVVRHVPERSDSVQVQNRERYQRRRTGSTPALR